MTPGDISAVATLVLLTVAHRDATPWDFSQDLGISDMALGYWELMVKMAKSWDFLLTLQYDFS